MVPALTFGVLEGEILAPLRVQRQIIAIDDIIIDKEDTQIRDRMDLGHVRVLVGAIQTYDEINPEEVENGIARGFESEAVEVDAIRGRHGDQVFHLVSGFHRVEAAKRALKRFVLADVFPDRGQPYREWRAGQANATHGKALKPKERKRQLHRYFRANLHKEPGPRGGLWRGDLKPPLQIRQENGGLGYRTFWKWTTDYSPLLAKQLREAFCDEQDEPEEPLPMTQEEIMEATNRRKANDALRLAFTLARTLQSRYAVDDFEARLESMLQAFRAVQPGEF
jgi:hypothetical protein